MMLALSSLAFVAQLGLSPGMAHAQSTPAWLTALNNVRTAAGLPAVTEDTASSAGAVNHSRYVVLNQTLTHTEDPSKPDYTINGAAAGQSGDVGGGAPAPQDMLQGYMASAFHWEGILDPGLVSVGYGSATYQDVGLTQAQASYLSAANTLVLTRNYAQATKPIMWPPSGGAMPYSTFSNGEIPNALFDCPGYGAPTGASLSVQLPATPQVSSVTLTQSGVSGNLANCWITGGTVKFSAADQAWATVGTQILNHANAVVVLPQAPLTTGTYCVSVLNTATPPAPLAQWSFSVGGSTAASPAPCGSAAVATATPLPASSAGQQVWGIGSASANIGGNTIEHYDATTGKWATVDGGATSVAVGPNGQPWIVNKQGTVFRRSQGATSYVDGSWQVVPGQAAAIAAGGDGSVWAIGTQNVAVGGAGIFHYNPNVSGSWDQVDGAAVAVAVGPDGQPWIVNAQGNIYRRSQGAASYVDGSWQLVPGQATAIAAGGDGSVWVIGTQTANVGGNMIYHYNPNVSASWDQVDGGAVGIAVDADGDPWLVNKQGAVFRRSQGTSSYVDGTWTTVSPNGTATDIGVGGPVS